MKSTVIIFGTLGGNTRVIAKRINEALGGSAKVIDVNMSTAADLQDYDNIILGTSTTGYGELIDPWIDFMPTINGIELNGKTIALFGLGDSSSFSDTFTNGMAELYTVMQEKGANIIGSVSTEGYTFDDSKSVVDGRFVGLALDEDNEDSQTPQRIKDWVAIISPQL
ncbi:MAG: flavodoxin [Rikenellaceae bacterium]